MTWKTQKEICAIAENSDWWTFNRCNRCTFLTCAHPGRHGCVQTWVCRGDGRWSPPERPWDGTPAEGSCDSPRGTDAPLAGGSRSWRSERASGPAPYHTPRWTAWTAEGRTHTNTVTVGAEHTAASLHITCEKDIRTAEEERKQQQEHHPINSRSSNLMKELLYRRSNEASLAAKSGQKTCPGHISTQHQKK